MRNKTPLHIVLLTILTCAIAAPGHAAIEVKTSRISHGVKVWYAESNQVPVVDIRLSFEGAGYASDPAGKEGRAALAAAMLTQGAGNLDALGFQRALDDGALQLSAVVEADRLIIRLHALRDQVERGGELLTLALAQPRFAPADLEREKTALITRIAQLNETPDYQTSRLFDTQAFAGHPYTNPPYGTAASLRTVTADDLKQYFTTYATRGNVMVSAAGDVDSTLLDTVLQPVIEALRDGDAATPTSSVTLQGGGTTQRQEMNVPQTVVQFAAPALARDDPKFYAAYLLNHILGGNGLVSRLADRVRQQKGLVYGITTEIDIRRGIPLLQGRFATRNATATEAVEEVKRTLGDLRDKGVTTEECTDAKTYVIGSNVLQLDNSRQVAGMLLSMQVNRLGEDYLEKRETYFNAVACADINRVAQELLDPSKFFFVMVGGDATAKTP